MGDWSGVVWVVEEGEVSAVCFAEQEVMEELVSQHPVGQRADSGVTLLA